MPVTRNTFLDCPPRYTRTERTADGDVRNAYAVEHTPTGYSKAWWVAIVIVCIAAAVVIVAGA